MRKELGVVPRFLASCSPLVAGDLVFVVTGNGVGGEKAKVVAPKAPSFLAVNKTTGKVVWSDNSPGDKIMEGQWSESGSWCDWRQATGPLSRRRRLALRFRTGDR